MTTVRIEAGNLGKNNEQSLGDRSRENEGPRVPMQAAGLRFSSVRGGCYQEELLEKEIPMKNDVAVSLARACLKPAEPIFPR
jgi:hypothetical protein